MEIHTRGENEGKGMRNELGGGREGWKGGEVRKVVGMKAAKCGHG